MATSQPQLQADVTRLGWSENYWFRNHGILGARTKERTVYHRSGRTNIRERCDRADPWKSLGRRFFRAKQISPFSGSCYHHRLFDIFLLSAMFQKNLLKVSRLQRKKKIPTNLHQRQNSWERPHTRNFSVHATKSFVTSRSDYVLRRGGFAGLRTTSDEETGSKQTVVRRFAALFPSDWMINVVSRSDCIQFYWFIVVKMRMIIKSAAIIFLRWNIEGWKVLYLVAIQFLPLKSSRVNTIVTQLRSPL